MAIDPIVPEAKAIVEAFYPSVRGAEALTMALLGETNRWGKLPVTMCVVPLYPLLCSHQLVCVLSCGACLGRVFSFDLTKGLAFACCVVPVAVTQVRQVVHD